MLEIILKNLDTIIPAAIGIIGAIWGVIQKARAKKWGEAFKQAKNGVHILTDAIDHVKTKLDPKSNHKMVENLKEAAELTGSREIIRSSLKAKKAGPKLRLGGKIDPADLKKSEINVGFDWEF